MKISKIWFADNRIYGLTDDGRTLWQSLLYYRRLQHATPEQREDYEMDDEGIHWYQLDEDVSFESFEYDDPEPTGVSLVFLSHPELNAAAVGRRLGISQSLIYVPTILGVNSSVTATRYVNLFASLGGLVCCEE